MVDILNAALIWHHVVIAVFLFGLSDVAHVLYCIVYLLFFLWPIVVSANEGVQVDVIYGVGFSNQFKFKYLDKGDFGEVGVCALHNAGISIGYSWDLEKYGFISFISCSLSNESVYGLPLSDAKSISKNYHYEVGHYADMHTMHDRDAPLKDIVSFGVFSNNLLAGLHVGLGSYSGFYPYIGVDLGASLIMSSAVMLEFSGGYYSQFSDSGSCEIYKSNSVWNFAYGADFGVCYGLNDKMALDFRYAYRDLGQFIFGERCSKKVLLDAEKIPLSIHKISLGVKFFV
ncbi:hypothetical protein Cyrtocomes_00154 [Candidatus Cyrtobacter comes]|uniref:Outer membrane protein beta-barrel domain-containing protein n=1 Tax=Candidatus Cyrtobacter comes TaxID=675776 RepID=A0ABU5L6P5_9RICK|nr:outer membrane beta-barrel protein [Candidatus Cyrtobacter comes]MDZ5761796.1 hypothetical protein [Candidatus Cyrtobacter comes]